MVSPNLSDKNQLMFETFIVLEGENHKSSRIPPSILSFLPSLALNWGSTISKPKNPPKWHRKPTFKRRCCHRNYSIEHPSSSMDVASRVVGILTLTSSMGRGECNYDWLTTSYHYLQVYSRLRNNFYIPALQQIPMIGSLFSSLLGWRYYWTFLCQPHLICAK